jgi:hypothetical protein
MRRTAPDAVVSGDIAALVMYAKSAMMFSCRFVDARCGVAYLMARAVPEIVPM